MRRCWLRLLVVAPNKISIVNFDSRPEAASPFTSDVAQWTEAINKPDQGDNGAAIYDGIAYALDLLKKEPVSNRRAILLISQERDSGSKTSMKEIVRDLGETNTAIYSITFSAEKAEAKLAFKEPHANPPIQIIASDGPIQPWTSAEAPVQAYFKLDAPLRLIFGAMQKNLSAEIANLSGGEAMSFDGRGRAGAGYESAGQSYSEQLYFELFSNFDAAGSAYDQGFAGASSGDDGVGADELLGGGFEMKEL